MRWTARLKWFIDFGTFSDLVIGVSVFASEPFTKAHGFLEMDGIQYSVTIIHIPRNGGQR